MNDRCGMSARIKTWDEREQEDACVLGGPSDTHERLQGHMLAEISELRRELTRAETRIDTLEAFRPHWAKGYTSDSVAAQSSTAALSQMWKALGVQNQTDAMSRLRAALAQKEAAAPAHDRGPTCVYCAVAIDGAAPGDLHAAIMALDVTNDGMTRLRHAAAELARAALAQQVAVDARLEFLYQIACVKPFISPITTKEKWIASIDAAIGAQDEQP